jgi:GntR family transcriptional regulator
MIQLSPMLPQPLRQQIVRQVREQILSGQLREHASLPSIRGLAREQRVGIVTVQRAFEDLEREGMIYARQGKGYFVAPIPEAARNAHARDLAASLLERPLHEAQAMGLDDAEIEDLVRKLLDRKGKVPS